MLNVFRMISQKRKIRKRETVEIFLRSHIGKGIDQDFSFPSPGEVGDREEILLLLEHGRGQFDQRPLSLSPRIIPSTLGKSFMISS